MIKRISRLNVLTQEDFTAMGQETAVLLIDVDNTLLGPTASSIDPSFIPWIKSLSVWHPIVLCTNNITSRQAKVGEALGLPILMRAFKPFPCRIRRFLKDLDLDPSQTVILGDQVVTDVCLALWMKRPYYLIKPMAKDRHWITRVLRILESLVITDE